MEPLTGKHWTERSTEDYLYKISSDFVRFIEAAMGDGMTQADLAKKLGVTEGRVSQFLNNPGNFTLKKIIEYARSLGLKVAIVGYNDGDRDNRDGPVPAEIFSKAWEQLGAPRDFAELNFCGATNRDIYISPSGGRNEWRIKLKSDKSAVTRRIRSRDSEKTAKTTNESMPYGVLGV